ncbi:MAG TPA: DEAD/DEAH box helicase [Patescibacteria group bacterium]
MNKRRFRTSNFKPNRNFRKRPQQKFMSKDELLQVMQSVTKSRIIDEPEVIQENPSASFESFGLSQEVLQNVTSKGYISPTPIQVQAIPMVMSGRDVIGIANTGTGKTAAFLIPLVNKILLDKSQRVLIIAPTRELAVQIRDELRNFAKGLGIYATLLIGGLNIRAQKGELRNNPHVVIGTPGRIKDLLQENSFSLNQFKNVVLDEADRMVDIGFIGDIKYFISLLPLDRQSLFFSATISGKVQEVLSSFVKNPLVASVKKQQTSQNIEQDIVKVENGYKKIDKLHDLLTQEGFDKVLIFGRTKWGIQQLTDELIQRGFRAAAIHGNKNQNQRQRALQQFKNNQIQILLATDIASRGLDIENVTHVINYEMPATKEDYIHRIGRTGRADKKGKALTFV